MNESVQYMKERKEDKREEEEANTSAVLEQYSNRSLGRIANCFITLSWTLQLTPLQSR